MGQFNQDGVQFNIQTNTTGTESEQSIYGKLYSKANKGWELEDDDTPSKLFNALEID